MRIKNENCSQIKQLINFRFLYVSFCSLDQSEEIQTLSRKIFSNQSRRRTKRKFARTSRKWKQTFDWTLYEIEVRKRNARLRQ